MFDAFLAPIGSIPLGMTGSQTYSFLHMFLVAYSPQQSKIHVPGTTLSRFMVPKEDIVLVI